MILRALHTSGILDISSQEALHVYNESEPFRVALRPGQVVEVEDHWRKLKNIHNAINAGLLEVVAYDYANVGEEVTHAELEERLAAFTPSTGFSSNIKLEISEFPLETPGVTRTFTLPRGHVYESGTVKLILNGQTLPDSDITENVGNQSITLAMGIPTPKSDDVVVLTYLRTVNPMETGEYPQEVPDGANRTFTLIEGDSFADGNIGVMINGIFVNPAYVTPATDGLSVTIDSPQPAPLSTDIVELMYSRVEGYPIEINVYSVEQPNGVSTTFTLPNGDTYNTGDVELLINGQRLPSSDFVENAGKTAVTLAGGIPVPVAGDVTTLIYVKPS